MIKLIKRFLRKLLGFLPLMGIGISFLMLLHSLWQLDLICVGPVWGTREWISRFFSWNIPNYCDRSFQCGFWFKTNVGIAYDYYLSLCVVSWFLLLASMYFWQRRNVKKLKEEIEKLKKEIQSNRNI